MPTLRLRLVFLCLAWLPLCASAGISVELEGLEGEKQAAVLASLGISSYADREVSAAQAQRLMGDVKAQVKQALRPFGYYAATVTSELAQVGDDWRVALQVDLGEPVKIAQVDIDVGEEPATLRPVKQALQSFHPRKGEVLDHAAYEKSKAALQTALTETGFLDARMLTHRVEVTLADKRAQIKLKFEPGQRYRFGQTRFEGGQFRDGFLQRYVPWEAGDYFSQTELLDLQQRLVDADYFAIVQIEPLMEQAEDGTVPLLVHLTPAKRSIYTGGPFIGTDTGFGIQLGLERRWVNSRGHKMSIHALIAERLKTVNAVYTIPLPGHNNRSFNFGLDLRAEDTVTSSSRTLSLVVNESRQWHGFRRSIGVRLLTGDFKVGGKQRNSTLLFPEITLAKKVGNEPLFVRHGWSVRGTARAGHENILTDTSFAQITLDAKWIQQFMGRNRLILRGGVGSTWVDDFSALHPQLRFFAGGARSIRGYDYQSVGPYNDDGFVIGGRNLLVGSVEVEHYFNRTWGMAAFVDAGDAFSDTDFDAVIGAGLGLRWLSPVGMVRVDLGVPINNDRESGVQLHIVIGPDL